MAETRFACTHCQKLMAVGPELLGHQVRCPHCHQVLVAPAPDSGQLLWSTNPPAEQEIPFSPPIGELPLTAAKPEASVAAPFDLAFSAATESVATGETREPTRTRIAGRPLPAPGTNWAMAALVPYALCMTVIAIFYYVKYSSALQDHPLEQIPDLLGEFQQKQTKTGSQSRRLPKPDQDLPARLVTNLGQPIRVGAIEVTPLAIEYRPWAAFVKEKGRPEPIRRPVGKTLVLRLRVKNLSPDLSFYPTDPYFDRRPKDATEKPYALVDVGGRKYFGGVMEYITESGSTERAWLDGREADNRPLGPGESRETVFLTYPRNNVFEAVQKSGGVGIWRVHVRRGMVPYHGTEIPASAVVGVAFTAADVKTAG